jgi:cation transport ATPase
MTKTCFRLFSITGYEAEEQWIHEMFLKGWKLVNVRFQCIYTFEETEPADMAVRLEYSDVPLDSRPDYEVMLRDYGWECLHTGAGWSYFARSMDSDPANNELFTDDASRLAMIRTIFRRRYMALFLLLVFLVVPGVVTSSAEDGLSASLVAWMILAAIYVLALVHCGLGFRKLLKEHNLNMDVTPSVRGLIVCALVAAVVIVLLAAGYATGGPFYDFWSAAFPWILGSVGVLALMLYMTGGSIDEE